jgi:hypothetical protein
MSSIPGYTLEAYLGWNFSITVEDLRETNVSMWMAEALGNITPRPVMSKPCFAKLVSYFEQYRHKVEYKLMDFDEENQSWRDYAGYAFDFIPEELDVFGERFVKLFPFMPEPPTPEQVTQIFDTPAETQKITFTDEWLQNKLNELKSMPGFAHLYYGTWEGIDCKPKTHE